MGTPAALEMEGLPARYREVDGEWVRKALSKEVELSCTAVTPKSSLLSRALKVLFASSVLEVAGQCNEQMPFLPRTPLRITLWAPVYLAFCRRRTYRAGRRFYSAVRQKIECGGQVYAFTVRNKSGSPSHIFLTCYALILPCSKPYLSP